MAVVLIVEDEPRIAQLLRRTLEHDGHTVHVAGDGTAGLRFARAHPVELVILDLGLPDLPGEELATSLRRDGNVPILMLTAKASERDRIAGLEAGADDYVTKPFSPREVALRVGAILRRGRAGPASSTVSYGDATLVIDTAEHRVTLAGEPVELTPTEWLLLEALAGRPGRVWSRYELVTHTRGYEFDGFERTIDSHIKNLRRKIEPDPRHPSIVETVIGTGYRFALDRDH